jgi:hypothetical protein
VSLGFTVRNAPFTYASWPGRWGTPVIGWVWVVTLIAAAHEGAHGAPHVALLLLVGLAAVVAVATRWVSREGLLLGKTPGMNLEATRGTPTHAAPALWLVAHLDSKSQPIPILLRAAAIVVSVVVWLAGVMLAAAQMAGLAAPGAWHPVALTGTLAGLLVAVSTVGAASPGALDNASGVAAILLAAERVDPSVALGVLLTSAEELGLAGARAWVRDQPRRAPVINCDTIDDRGYLTIMHSHGRPERLIRAFERRAVRARRVLPGILVDAIAFADAGWDAVTVSRGTLSTLARVHSRADTPAALTGAGVAEAANSIAEAVGRLSHV